MKVTYDAEADAAYIQLSDLQPAGVVEAEDGINLDMTEDNKLVGIEILDASKKFPIETLYKYELEQQELVEA
jgi:uncharacterized protein YuzE